MNPAGIPTPSGGDWGGMFANYPDLLTIKDVAEITGMGNYSGKTSVTFEIVKQSFRQEVVSFFRTVWNTIKDFFVSIFG